MKLAEIGQSTHNYAYHKIVELRGDTLQLVNAPLKVLFRELCVLSVARALRGKTPGGAPANKIDGSDQAGTCKLKFSTSSLPSVSCLVSSDVNMTRHDTEEER